MTAAAKSWSQYGTPIFQPRVGAITVLRKEASSADASMTSSGWHVAFYIGGPAQAPTLLGGNQKNMVCRKLFKDYPVIYYRWPSDFVPLRMPRTRYA